MSCVCVGVGVTGTYLVQWGCTGEIGTLGEKVRGREKRGHL